MKLTAALLSVALYLTIPLHGYCGTDQLSTRFTRTDQFNAPRFEVATESAFILGCFGNPHNYEIATQFVTARLRWGAIHDETSWWRGYNQVYVLAMGEYFERGLENHYFGISAGLRYNFLPIRSRFSPCISGGVGLGDVDATKEKTPGALGQNFTFNILTAVGCSYRISDQWQATAGILYQHLSNAGLSEPDRPNSSLNAIGPQFGITRSF